MAYNLQTSIPISFQPGENLSANQFLFVRLGTDGLLYACDNSHYALGVLSNVPSKEIQGQYAGTVDVVGVTRLAVYSTYPIGTFICPGVASDATGIGMSVADASSSDTYIRGWTLQAAANAYDVVAVQLIDPSVGGTQGATGLMGPTGYTGVQGQGSTGVQGLRGVTGVQGLTGNTGVQGVTGVAP